MGGRPGTTYTIRAYAFDGWHVDSAPFTVVNPVTFRVFFHMNGAPGTAPGAQDVIQGETAAQPENPVSEGREFRGWYIEPEALNAYDFSTPVIQATVLYAGWDRYWTVTFAGGANRADVNLTLPDSRPC